MRGDAIAGGDLRWRFARKRADAAVKVMHVDLRIREGSDCDEEALTEANLTEGVDRREDLKESDDFWGNDEGN